MSFSSVVLNHFMLLYNYFFIKGILSMYIQKVEKY